MKPFKCTHLCYCIIWFNFYYIIKSNKYILLLFQLGQYFWQLPFWNISYWVFANYCLFKTIENLYSQARFLFKSQRSPFYVLEILIMFTVCFLLMDDLVSVPVGMTMTLNPNGVGVKVEPVKGSASSSSKANKTLSA